MATLSINRMMLWTDIEDREIEGRWHTGRLVRPEGRAAWFEATANDGTPVMLGITETLNDDYELLQRLRASSEIEHPNVVRIFEAIGTRLDDSPVVIAVMERTEENLGDVLRDRILSAAEAQVVLEALVQGIAAIHSRCMVHSRMEPSSILAIGETIKLRSDTLQVPPVDFAAAAAANVKGIGRIVTQAMTRKDPSGENDPVLQLIPEPMARAVRRALSGHARIEEIAAFTGISSILAKSQAPHPKQVVPKPALGIVRGAEAAVPERVSAEQSAPAEPGKAAEYESSVIDERLEERLARHVELRNIAISASNAVQPTAEPVSKAPAVVPDNQSSQSQPAEPVQRKLFYEAQPARVLSHRTNGDDDVDPWWSVLFARFAAAWVVIGGAVIVFIVFFVIYGLMHHSSTKATQEPPAAPLVVTQPAQPQPSSSAHAQIPPAPAQTGSARPVWRVVVYTYGREADAQHKADTLGQKYPQLKPSVFSPHGSGLYLVTLGGSMTRDQAIALRMEALRLGLPHDTFARNYRE